MNKAIGDTYRGGPTRTVCVAKTVKTAVQPTRRVLETAAMFGLGVDQERLMTIVPAARIPLRGGEIVFITGPSGGGKTTLLRLIAEDVGDCIVFGRDRRAPSTAHHGPCPSQPIIESLGDTLEDAVRLLSIAGLADAFVMLRCPGELSDGQRYRFELARMIEEVETRRRNEVGDTEAREMEVAIADEFGATLDRVMAIGLARNVARWVRQRGDVCFVAATTHDDLLEAFAPDVLVWKGLDEVLEIHERGRASGPDAGGGGQS